MSADERPTWSYRKHLPELFFQDQLRVFHRLREERGICEVRQYQIGPVSFSLESCQPGFLNQWGRALRLLEVESPGPRPWRIRVWDDEEAGWRFQRPEYPLNVGHTHRLVNLNTRTVRQFHQDWLDIYSGVHLGDRTGYYVTGGLSHLPVFERAAPMRPLLNALLNSEGFALAHAASLVDHEGRGMILAGGPNHGKSTTTTRWLAAGGLSQGDDICALGGADPTSLMTCQAMKLRPQGEEIFPGLQKHFHAFEEFDERKNLFWFEDAFPGRHALSASVRALLLPEVGSGPATEVHPATPLECMRALIPFSNQQIPTSDNLSGNIFLRFIKNVPSFRVVLGSDPDHLLDVLNGLLAGQPQTPQL